MSKELELINKISELTDALLEYEIQHRNKFNAEDLTHYRSTMLDMMWIETFLFKKEPEL